MRLGEILVATGQLTGAQIDHALRTQVMWGGRLGSVLVELELIDLDAITRALASQKRMAAALQQHFTQASVALQRRLPAGLAADFQCIPITELPGATGESQIAIAATGPLPPAAIAEIAEHLGVTPGRIVVGIAAEMRIRYQLERTYGIPREQRFLRARAGRITEPPPAITVAVDDGLDDAPLEDSDVAIAVPSDVGDSAHSANADIAETVLPAQELYPTAPSPPVGDPKAQRRYMKTLADEPSSALPAFGTPSDDAPTQHQQAHDSLLEIPVTAATGTIASPAPRATAPGRTQPPLPPSAQTPPGPAATPTAVTGQGAAISQVVTEEASTAAGSTENAPSEQALGRIALRKAAIAAGPAQELHDHTEIPATQETALRAIRRATDRDRVARLAIEGCLAFAPGVHTAALFILRGDVAIGWKASHLGQDTSATAVNVVVPLDMPNTMADVVRSDATAALRQRSEPLSDVDRRLLDTFAAADSARNLALCVVPVRIKGQPACVLVTIGVEASPSTELVLAEIANSMAAAFSRLMRAAGR